MYYFFAFILGCIIGSFLNVVIDRLSTGRSIVKGRSYCENCRKTLQPLDLIPVFSYLLLCGKCRYCSGKIPLRLLIVEITTGLFFVFLYFEFLSSSISLYPMLSLLIVTICFIGIFFADITYGIIPDALTLFSLLASYVFLILTHAPLMNHALTGIGTWAFFLALFMITKGRGMGFGDVKLSFVLGFLLGFPLILVAMYLAFLTGALVSIILIIWKKVRFSGGKIPFGPFLVGSAFLALFFGNQILLHFIARFM